MFVTNLSAANHIYHSQAVSMKGTKPKAEIVKDFSKFMDKNGLFLDAKITPDGDSFAYKIELKQGSSYSSKLTSLSYAQRKSDCCTGFADEGVTAEGKTLEDAIIDMAKTYKNKYVKSPIMGEDAFKFPDFTK